MIDAKSLRIGNYVCGTPMAVPRLGFFSDGITQVQSLGIHLIDTKQWVVDPIPLSEDILIKAGFERFHTNPRLENFYIEREGYYPFQVYVNRDGQVFFNENIKLEYVHELQNLYYCHQKSELNIQLVWIWSRREMLSL